MFCDKCGKQLPDNARFCDGCGNVLEQSQQGTAVPYQQGYNQHVNANNWEMPQGNYNNLTSPMGLGQWILTIFLFGIPIVGFVLMIMSAFGGNVNLNKKNYARAMLIFGIIALISMFFMGGVLARVMQEVLAKMS